MTEPRSPSRDRVAPVDTAFLVLGCAVAMGIVVWLTWGVWHPGLPTGGDTGAHAVRSDYALSTLFPNLELDGWQSRFGLGYQQSLFIGPGFTVLIGLVRALSFGTMSALDAFKATGVLSLVLVPIGVAFVALSFGLGRRTAGVAAVLSLTVSSQYGGAGLTGVYVVGLWTNQAATIFLLLAFGGIVRIVRHPTRRRVLWTAIATAAVVLTHPVATVVLGVLALALLIAAAIERAVFHRAWLITAARGLIAHPGIAVRGTTHPSDDPERTLLSVRRRVVALAGAAVLAVGLAAVQVIPLIAHSDLAGNSSNWDDANLPGRFGDLWRGDFIFRPWVFLLVLVGFGFAFVVSRRQPMALSVALTPIVFLVLGRVFITIAPHNDIAIRLTNRGFAYVGLLAILPLSMLVATATRTKASLEAEVDDQEPNTAGRFVTELAASLPALIVAVTIVLLPTRLGRAQAATVSPLLPFAHAAEELRSVVPEGARFATVETLEDEGPKTGVPHPDFWVAWASGKDTLNVFNLESSSVRDPLFTADGLSDPDPNSGNPDARADALSRLGVSHVLVVNMAKATKLASSPRYRGVWQEGTMAIYEIVPPDGQPSPAALISSEDGPLAAQTDRDDPEHVHIHATTPTDTDATVAIAWSPKWHATVDGHSVAVGRTPDGLIAVALPAGDSDVVLSYGPDVYDALGRVVTLGSSIVAVGLLVQDRRRRQSPRNSSSHALV